MQAQLGYDRPMRYWTLVSTLSLLVILALSAHAQVNGVPPSVTSFGFGGHHDFGGVPPSVTSLGPNGFGPMRGPRRIEQPPFRPAPDHRRNRMDVYPYFIPYYPVVDPYAYGGPVAEQAPAAADEEQEDPYQGGPTIFDRRGSGARHPNDYEGQDSKVAVPRPDPAPEINAEAAPLPAPSPVASQPNTILVFKDGHKQEVGNYAIVGTNLFDLTPGHRQKIALGDLDVPATEKANDDQGVDFKLPELPSGN